MIIHLFFHFNYVMDVWSNVLQLLSSNWVFPNPMKLFIEGWSNCPFSHNVIVDLWNQVPPFVTWWLWKERNNRIFREVERSSGEVFQVIRIQIKENIEASRYNFSNTWPNYKEMRIKKNWGIRRDLTNLNCSNMLNRMGIV